MSRSGYSDDCENLNLYRGNVDRSLAGRRGQAFLAEMAAALDAMPDKKLSAKVLARDGEACALGVVAIKRGLDVSTIDETEPEDVAAAFGISRVMAAEIAYVNDECGGGYRNGKFADTDDTSAQRWERVRKWVAEHTKGTP